MKDDVNNKLLFINHVVSGVIKMIFSLMIK